MAESRVENDGQRAFGDQSPREATDTIVAVRVLLEISGHARARYARIDRRDYRELARTLDRDDRLGADLDLWKRAIAIWYIYRPNNQDIPLAELGELESLSKRLSNAVYERPEKDLALADHNRRHARSGKLPTPLTPALIQERYPDYASRTTQTVLANYA